MVTPLHLDWFVAGVPIIVAVIAAASAWGASQSTQKQSVKLRGLVEALADAFTRIDALEESLARSNVMRDAALAENAELRIENLELRQRVTTLESEVDSLTQHVNAIEERRRQRGAGM